MQRRINILAVLLISNILCDVIYDVHRDTNIKFLDAIT